RLLLLDHPDYLRLGETALSQVSAPSVLAQTLHHGEGSRGGQVTKYKCKSGSLHPRRGHFAWFERAQGAAKLKRSEQFIGAELDPYVPIVGVVGKGRKFRKAAIFVLKGAARLSIPRATG
ncbi:hypothetical protein, partial [Sagittula marina]|uniref:hypothetical protein n=1 Tax=Sagittula marina TaxID=943940 RepID=UPI0031D8833F